MKTFHEDPEDCLVCLFMAMLVVSFSVGIFFGVLIGITYAY